MKINLTSETKYNLYNVADGDILMVRICNKIHPILYKEDAETDNFFVICLNDNKFAKNYLGAKTTLDDVFVEWGWELVEIIQSEELEIKRI